MVMSGRARRRFPKRVAANGKREPWVRIASSVQSRQEAYWKRNGLPAETRA